MVDLLFALAALLAVVGQVFGFFQSVAYYKEMTHAFIIFAVSPAFLFLFYAGAVPRRQVISLADSVFRPGLMFGATWRISERSTSVGGGD